MLTNKDLDGYRFPGLVPLNEQQKGFFVDVMNGVDQTTAYIKHYGNTDSTCAPSVLAHNIIRTDWFKSYKSNFEKIMFEREIQETGWNYDLAILERRRLYSLNLLEVERLAHSHDKEIEYYTNKKLKAIEEDDEDKIDYYEQKILKAIKSKNMSLASNQACQQALDGLDKLAGLQTVNLNHTGNVNFFGDDMWEELEEGENIVQQITDQQETTQDD